MKLTILEMMSLEMLSTAIKKEIRQDETISVLGIESYQTHSNQNIQINFRIVNPIIDEKAFINTIGIISPSAKNIKLNVVNDISGELSFIDIPTNTNDFQSFVDFYYHMVLSENIQSEVHGYQVCDDSPNLMKAGN